MTGIKIPVSADVSGVNDAMNALVAKAKQLNSTLSSGKATLDVSGAKKAMGDLERLADNLHKQLEKAGSAEVGGDALDGLSGQFESAIKEAQELAAAMAAVGVQSAGGFSKSATATRALIREMERARQLQKVMQREGQTLPMSKAIAAEREFQRRVAANVPGSRKYKQNNGLGSVVDSWRDMAMNEVDARRRRRDLLQSVGIAAGGGGGAGAGGGGGPAPAPAGPRGFVSFMGGTASRAGRSALSAALPNMGVEGSIMHSAVEEAAATGGGMFSGAGLARLAGGAGIGALAFGAVKGIGAIKSRVSAAEGEGAGYADMSRSMGAVTADFNELRTAVRGAIAGMGLSNEEGQKLAKEYERASWTMSPDKLGTEVRGAVGFSRGMGLDPSHGVDFFSTLRSNRVSSGDADNRRIALMLADAIGKAGVFNKADEVLSAVSSFTVQATRASFTTANISGYAGGMTSLIGTGLAGMDPSASASILNKADHAIRNPGSLAVQNFLLGMGQQASPDMNARDLGLLTDGGAFATMAGQFGTGSAAQASTKDPALLAHYRKLAKDGGNTTTIERLMKRAKSYGLGDDWTRTNLKDILHLSDSEAAAFMAADAQGGGIGKSLEAFKAQGFDVGTMNPSAVKGIISSQYGTNASRRVQAAQLRRLGGDQRLSDEDRRKLEAAEANPGKDDEALKAILPRLLASRDMPQTEGDESRQQMKSIENAVTDFASKLIPIANSIREGIMWGLKKTGYNDTYGTSEAAKSRLTTNLAAVSTPQGRLSVLRSEMENVISHRKDYTPEYGKYLSDALDRESLNQPVGESAGGAAGAVDLGGNGSFGINVKPYEAAKVRGIIAQVKGKSPYDKMFKDAAAEFGVPYEALKARSVQESGLQNIAGPRQSNGDQAFGLMQLSKGKIADLGIDWRNPQENIRAGARIMRDNLQAARGDSKHAAELYYAGSEKGIGPNSLQYGENWAAIQRGLTPIPAAAPDSVSTPLPGGASSAPSVLTHNVRIGGSAEVRVRMPDGSAQSVPFNVTQMGSPKVSGAGSPFAGAMQ